MSRVIEIRFEGKESSFRLERIERSKLYGLRRRIPVDAQGRECSFASLTEDGRFILPKGSTAQLYLDGEGEVVERSRLRAVDTAGEAVRKEEGEALELKETAPAVILLDYAITFAYHLEPVYISSNLQESLSQGTIYSLPYFLHNGEEGRQAFLLSGDAGYFILSGERTGFDFIGLSEADLSPPDRGDELLEDLDFSMW